MRVKQDGDLWQGTHVPGPSHDYLGLRLSTTEDDPGFEVTVHPSKTVDTGERSEALRVAKAAIHHGIEAAFGELGVRYGVEVVEIVADDSWRPAVLTELARRIVHAHHNAVSNRALPSSAGSMP